MNIGSVSPVEGKGFIGTIATLTMDMRIALVPVESDSARAPKFEIRAQNPARRWVRVGALWETTARDTGLVFLTGQLDDPSLPSKVYLAAFPQTDGSISIVWSRPERQDEMRSANTGGMPKGGEGDPFGEPPVDAEAQGEAKPQGRGRARRPSQQEQDDQVPF